MSQEQKDHQEAGPTSAETRPAPTPSSEGRFVDLLLGKHVGAFSIRRLIGAGGMGKVYEAIQDHPRRTVALKIMKPGIASRSAMRRFEFEAQTLARLHHPGIAQIYEAGTYDDGSGAVPYFAMEYISGATTITEYADRKKLSTRERLDLFGLICEAVECGHQKGIIHRDLKPSNILVDAAGQPKVIDFGLARATDSDMAVTSLQTNVGDILGTLHYMAPEQFDPDPHDLDTRADVYALGVVLYELLCGRTPFDLGRAAIHEAARMVREDAPTRPSSINRALRGDVETIVLKALDKEKQRRYRSAADLGDDIRKFLMNEPIVARPPSVIYQIRLFARRNKGVFSAAAAAVAVLLAATVVSTYFGVRESIARAKAQLAEQAARLSAEEAQQQRANAESAAADARGAKVEADHQRDAALFQLYAAKITAAQASIQANEVVSARQRLEEAPEHLRGWEWFYLHAQLFDRSLAVLRGHGAAVTSVAFSPDGTRIASGSWDKTMRLWDASSGQELAVLRGYESKISSVAFSPDGTRLASASWDAARALQLWNVSSGHEPAVLWGPMGRLESIAFSPDGTRIASGSWDSTVRLSDASGGQQPALLRGHENAVLSVAFSPDGTRIVSGSTDKTVRLWDAPSGQELAVLRGHEQHVSSVAFSPDGTRIASGSGDNTVRLWDASSGQELVVLRGHEQHVSSVAFSPDRTRIASGSWDRTVRLWDASSGQGLAVLRGHEGSVYSVAFCPDGTRIASASDDLTVRLWDRVPYGQRAAEREESRRAEEIIRPTVNRLFDQGLEPGDIAARIRSDQSLRDLQRRAALNLVLARSSALRDQRENANPARGPESGSQ